MKKLVFLPPATFGGKQNDVYRVFAVDSKNFINDALQTNNRDDAVLHLEALKKKYGKDVMSAK